MVEINSAGRYDHVSYVGQSVNIVNFTNGVSQGPILSPTLFTHIISKSFSLLFFIKCFAHIKPFRDFSSLRSVNLLDSTHTLLSISISGVTQGKKAADAMKALVRTRGTKYSSCKKISWRTICTHTIIQLWNFIVSSIWKVESDSNGYGYSEKCVNKYHIHK